MTDEQREDQNRQNAEREADRASIIKLYRGIQAISNEVPNFHNPAIDKTANTILEGLKLMEQWLATQCQIHFKKS